MWKRRDKILKVDLKVHNHGLGLESSSTTICELIWLTKNSNCNWNQEQIISNKKFRILARQPFILMFFFEFISVCHP